MSGTPQPPCLDCRRTSAASCMRLVISRKEGDGLNAIIKYPGAKWGIAEWIISHFPPHHSYLEPFFGSGAVLFNKQRSAIETVNDLDGNVVNLFEWI